MIDTNLALPKLFTPPTIDAKHIVRANREERRRATKLGLPLRVMRTVQWMGVIMPVQNRLSKELRQRINAISVRK